MRYGSLENGGFDELRVVDEECYPYRTFKERKRCEITAKNSSLLRCQADPSRLVGKHDMLFSRPAYPVNGSSEVSLFVPCLYFVL